MSALWLIHNANRKSGSKTQKESRKSSVFAMQPDIPTQRLTNRKKFGDHVVLTYSYQSSDTAQKLILIVESSAVLSSCQDRQQADTMGLVI